MDITEPLPPRRVDRVPKRYSFGALAAILVIASFIVGVFFGEWQRSVAISHEGDQAKGNLLNREALPPYALKDVDFQGFWDIWKTVHDRSVYQPTSDVKMYYGAIEGMVASLDDPYSVYFDPEFAQKFSSELEGTFDGIGAEVGTKNGNLTVIAPLPGSPAANAGVKAGDRILEIDGVDTTGMLIDDAVNRIRGKKGTQVKLLIMRDGLKEPKEITITRDTIVVQPVKWAVKQANGKKLFIITLTQFNDKTDSEFDAAVRAAVLENPAGIILDLRNNPGGYLDSAVKVAGDWIPHGTVVAEKFSDATIKNHDADGAGRLADIPTVVLVNEGSASAAEILSGALQDDGKAQLVGEKTYGKGSVQDYTEFADGSALKLTVALWLTPKGRSINKEGIAPDVEVKLTEDDFSHDRDPQLDKAIQMLTVVPKTTGVK